MKRFIKKFGNALCDYIFTVHCPYCGKVIPRGELACNNCKSHFPENAITEYAIGGYKCAVAFPYSGQFKDAIISFKFKNCGAYAKLFAKTLTDAINEVFPNEHFDVVTSVPMHKKAEKERGYNQARLLARECALILDIEYAELLEKYKENKPQHSIKAEERAKNVKGVYRIPDKTSAYGKSVLIIDDVITTGNTLGECARTLKSAGCKDVFCAALCAR